ncbi:MAG TPA: 2-amino-4-hydroxy-6-hydroxymethyldihydropteridine diphosphokinase [Tepidisphaeraceae bacterium]|jgi:2-amino-4-hydroxy-6-hydroxymethyldihydropteridine diphosphokinase
MRNGNGVTAYIAIGSNLGDRARACYEAVRKLVSHSSVSLVAMSELIETAPVGGPAWSPPYLNGAIAVETTLGAHALFSELMSIEKALGRQHFERWGPRTVDLDLLLFGDRILSSDDLIVPHPLMHERRFVLEPLVEIAPNAMHPALLMTARGLLDNLK